MSSLLGRHLVGCLLLLLVGHAASQLVVPLWTTTTTQPPPPPMPQPTLRTLPPVDQLAIMGRIAPKPNPLWCYEEGTLIACTNGQRVCVAYELLLTPKGTREYNSTILRKSFSKCATDCKAEQEEVQKILNKGLASNATFTCCDQALCNGLPLVDDMAELEPEGGVARLAGILAIALALFFFLL